MVVNECKKCGIETERPHVKTKKNNWLCPPCKLRMDKRLSSFAQALHKNGLITKGEMHVFQPTSQKKDFLKKTCPYCSKTHYNKKYCSRLCSIKSRSKKNAVTK